jgi:hypothetical protein
MYDFCWFYHIFLALEVPKLTKSVLLKTGPVNRSVYRNSARFTNSIQSFHQFEFCTGFQLVLSIFGETNKTGPVQFLGLCRFLKPWHDPHLCCRKSIPKHLLHRDHHSFALCVLQIYATILCCPPLPNSVSELPLVAVEDVKQVKWTRGLGSSTSMDTTGRKCSRRRWGAQQNTAHGCRACQSANSC